ncbi:MAG: GIY-YIG nuclease family protein [Candidatus Marinimicrobia bacterium]|nr:GIY-YIG nuclease family protein [Candidatus Neomarinimicrobiota bacterium]
MYFVYIIQSVNYPDKYYTGMTRRIGHRVREHNRHAHEYSSRFKPWELRTYIAFDSKEKAAQFEKYLKTPSGRAFAKRRF